MREHILESHGPLCAAYDAKDGAFHAEGDTPAFLHVIPNGLQSFESPDWGGGGGRYVNVRHNVWMDPPPAADWKHPEGRWFIDNSWSKRLENVTEPNEQLMRTAYFRPIWRWLPQVQNDFAARAGWCFKDYASANHPPEIRLRETPLKVTAAPGEYVSLDASPSNDPGGDILASLWWHYVEAGTYRGAEIAPSKSLTTTITIPAAARPGDEIHMICEVTDEGDPPLTRYQRVVISIKSP